MVAAAIVLAALPARSAINWPYLLPGVKAQPGASAPRIIALTFDDGPDETTLRIARYLNGESIPATFFLLGVRAKARPDIVGELAALGFELGNHSMTHANLTKLDESELRAELVDCNEAIAAAMGASPRYFRPP